jgi:hypothetical protein
MAVVQYWSLGSVTTLMGAELNSLASSSGLTAGAVTAGSFNNVQGGGGLGGYTMGIYELNLAAPAAALTAGTAAYVWLLNQVDGTNFEDGGAAVIPARPADVIIPVRATTTQRIIWLGYLPPNLWKVLLSHNTGQTWNASGNTLKVLPVTTQAV